MTERKLTFKQRAFAEHYAVTGNGAQSAIKAGYSEKTARAIAAENLTKPNVAAAVARAKELHDAGAFLTREKILARTWEIALESRDPKAQVAACTLLARCFGMIRDKHEIVAKIQASMTYEQRLRVLADPESRRTLEAIARKSRG